ncbi:MAG: hypothetical protein HYS17_08085 [Micavibrio aeruginosavorus]|uniref:SMP-30/Gluconolactonase/LRE-like region domain-containing protein n=1 Tax=Micavibrio aeruginosavorus TaxID=349221 RepID=A0A7T5R0W2_9BACT|nr:MAG: hypothetical protein HYS17_08085 [Micavibrio aeruginosavorus]
MKRFLRILSVLVLAVLLSGMSKVSPEIMALKKKGDRVVAGIERLIEQNHNPAEVVALAQHVPKLVETGRMDEANETVDAALALIEQIEAQGEVVAPEPPDDSYGPAEMVEIEGYDGHIMEPFLTTDGKYLLFNNENYPEADTDLHIAERTGTLSFKYLGKLKGANTRALDGAPSMDSAGNVYFTTTRAYGDKLDTIYTGVFDGKRLKNVRVAPGHISPDRLWDINMDVSISPDGRDMYISRATFMEKGHVPIKSDIMLAHAGPSGFEIDPHGTEIMKNQNTEALEYAPAITGDGLTLFYTRAAEGMTGLRILVATRADKNAVFDTPKVIPTITGFVEAPTFSPDASELFFHKKKAGKFRVFRVARK